MDLIQSRQEQSLAAALMLITVAACGLLYVLVPPDRPETGAGYRLERAAALQQADAESR